jgi:hypothetical protein
LDGIFQSWLLIVDSFPGTITPRSGTWSAWIGGDYDDTSYVQQQTVVSLSCPYFIYWHWIASEDACGYDFGRVLVNDIVVDTVNLCSSTQTGGWAKHVVNLGAYAGQSVSLQIRAETDSSLNSNLFVDDVGFESSVTSDQGISSVADSDNVRSRSGARTSPDAAKHK